METKNISIFETPPDVKGTVSLTYSHGLQPDDQWLYLPALKRVKRINSKNKSGPFMGSEFAFEDIGSQEVEKYSYRYTGDEKANGVDCYVIERIPQYEYSGYTRQITWINKAEFRAEKIYFYDRKNSLLKTLVFTDYKQIPEPILACWKNVNEKSSNRQKYRFNLDKLSVSHRSNRPGL